MTMADAGHASERRIRQPAAQADRPAGHNLEHEAPDVSAALLAERERAGLTQDDVAAALGVSRQMVSYWENGTRKPRPQQITVMAQIFGCTLSTLLTPHTEADVTTEAAAAMLYRRAGGNLSPEARRGISYFIKFLDLFGSLGGKLNREVTGMTASPFLPGRGFSEYASDARRKAIEVRSFLGLGLGPIADLDGVCAMLGVTVYRAELGGDLARTISGAFYKHPQVGFATLVNFNMTPGRQRFTLAHELAHALLHSGDDSIVVSSQHRVSEPRERFADAFAGEFLMPEEGIRRSLEDLGAGPKVTDVLTVISLQRLFNVSYITALVRLHQAKIISTRTLESLRHARPVLTAKRLGFPISQDEISPSRDRGATTRFPCRFRALVREAYRREAVGLTVLREALDLDDDDLDELVGDPGPDDTAEDPAAAQEWAEFQALGLLA